MGVKGFNVGGSVEKYEYGSLEDAPLTRGTGNNSAAVVNESSANTASGNSSFAAGHGTVASGENSAAFGRLSISSGQGSFAGGNKTSSADYPTTASGLGAFAWGASSRATGSVSFAFGQMSDASGTLAVAIGNRANASGGASAAIGHYVSATGTAETVIGKYNSEDDSKALIVGNGSSEARSNALTLDWDGNLEIAGDIKTEYGSMSDAHVTDTVAGAMAYIPDGANNVPVKALTVKFDPAQSGSGDPAPDNYRPITGWTGVSVGRYGKNIADYTNAVSWLNSSTTVTVVENGVSIVADTAAQYRAAKINIPYLPYGTTWTLSADVSVTSGTPVLSVRRTSNSILWKATTVVDNGHMSVNFVSGGLDDVQISLFGTYTTSEVCDVTFTNIQLEPGDVETEYEPYSETMYDVSWEDEAGTVYGGTLDVTTGLLTRTFMIAEFRTGKYEFSSGPLNAYTNSYVYGNTGIGGAIKPNTSSQVTNAICTHLPSTSRTIAGSSGMNQIGIFQYHDGSSNSFHFAFPREEQFSTYTKVMEWFDAQHANGNTCCVAYPLATPSTYQLSPTEVKTLLGKNVFTTNVGRMDIKYHADTSLHEGVTDRTYYNVATYNGKNLRYVFGSAEEFHNAIASGDFYNIHIGDYWPIILDGTYYDYGQYTVPSGTTYYSDSSLTTVAGTTSSDVSGTYSSATAIKITISSTTYYVAIGDCTPGYPRTTSKAVLRMEVASINPYIRTGDTEFSQPHLVMCARDLIPVALRMRVAPSVWFDATQTNPWRGSALWETLNNDTNGYCKLIEATDIGPYVYAGPNGKGMRAYVETMAPEAASPTTIEWIDRGKLFVPTEREAFGSHSKLTSSYVPGNLYNQWPIFNGSARHIVKGLGDGGSRTTWWLANFSSASYVSCMSSYGGSSTYSAGTSTNGVPVCFILV